MTIRTEAHVMENWRRDASPFVSILCITYNHEEYISKAIDSFLEQETNFPYEIIIHDDASTDKTPEIIKAYNAKYPNIIKPIFQTENQLSKHKKNPLLIAASCANGEYIALCEGDDYWTDSKKLTIQITEMQKNPNCDISFHPVFGKFIDKNKPEKVLAYHSDTCKIFYTKELILGAAKFCQTASLVVKTNILKTMPEWFWNVPIGDYFLQIIGSQNGGALYINKVMAVYRVSSSGSWSERMSHDENFAYDYYIRMLKSLDDINKYTQYKFTNEFGVIRNKFCFYMAINPVLALQKRKEIFLTNSDKFDFKRKLVWHLIFKKNKIAKLALYIKKNIFS